MSSKKTTGQKAQVKSGNQNRTTQSSTASKKQTAELNPALYLSPLYGNFKKVAATVTESLKPLGLSISQLEKAVSHYDSQKYTFEVDKTLLIALSDYRLAKVAWESFRDSFRAETDAKTIPSGVLERLIGDAQKASQTESEEEEEKTED